MIVSEEVYCSSSQSSFDSKWEGESECDEARGEIYGMIEVIDQQEELHGAVSLWDGDESDYKAVRMPGLS